MRTKCKRLLQTTALALVASTTFTGCMGNNALSKKVVKGNLSVTEHRWGREGVFLGLHIFWVYRIATICDLLVFNSIEFWSGENPINGKSALVDMPMDEVQDKFGFNDVESAKVERLSATEAKLYLQFTDGDRLTFDVIREQEDYTISYLGREFFKNKITQ